MIDLDLARSGAHSSQAGSLSLHRAAGDEERTILAVDGAVPEPRTFPLIDRKGPILSLGATGLRSQSKNPTGSEARTSQWTASIPWELTSTARCSDAIE